MHNNYPANSTESLGFRVILFQFLSLLILSTFNTAHHIMCDPSSQHFQSEQTVNLPVQLIDSQVQTVPHLVRDRMGCIILQKYLLSPLTRRADKQVRIICLLGFYSLGRRISSPVRQNFLTVFSWASFCSNPSTSNHITYVAVPRCS